MTEAEWLACDDPARMLSALASQVTQRKLQLFLVALARAVIGSDPASEFRDAIDVAERHADGLADENDLNQYRWQLLHYATGAVERGERHLLNLPALKAAKMATYPLKMLRTFPMNATWHRDLVASFGTLLPEIMRECFGSLPVSQPVFRDGWRTATVAHLASAAYTEHAFDRLPILADALEDAGCDNRDILDHCRGPGPHVRGCWVVDLVLGKQ